MPLKPYPFYSGKIQITLPLYLIKVTFAEDVVEMFE